MPQTNEGQKHSNSHLIRMKLINPLVEWHLRTNWTIEDRCPWTASNKISKRNICGSNHTNPFKQLHSHVINRIEQHLQSKLSEEYGSQWTAGKKWGTNFFQEELLDISINICGSNHTHPFKQQFLVLTHSHVINRIEQHLLPKLSEEDGSQRTAGKKWGTNAFQAHLLDKSIPTKIRFPDL